MGSQTVEYKAKIHMVGSLLSLAGAIRDKRDDFLTQIFIIDDTWVHYYTPESKVSSKECRKKEEPPGPSVRLCVLYSRIGGECRKLTSCTHNVPSIFHTYLTFRKHT